MSDARATAAPARFPYVEHRSVAQADRDERLEAEHERRRAERARPTFRDQLTGILCREVMF